MSRAPWLSWEHRGAAAVGVTFLLGGLLAVCVNHVAGLAAAALICMLGAIAAASVAWWLIIPYGERVERLTARVTREAGLTEVVRGGDQLVELDHAVNGLVVGLARARRHLRRHQALEDAIFSSSLGGLVVTGRKGLIQAVNPMVRDMLPVVPTPLGKRPIEAIPFTPLARALDDAATTGEPVEQECVSGRFDLILRAVPLGESGGAIAVIVDITTARRAERARSDFVANVSHELRTPITSILGYAETLLAMPEGLDEDTVDMLETVLRNAQRLSNIFNDLLQLSRIEARQGDLPLERLPLLDPLEEVVDRFMGMANTKRVGLTLECPEALSAEFNPEAFGHVVGNLVENAVKYTPEGGAVEVRAFTEKEDVVIEVEDNGPGIDPRHHSRIFERFYRVDPGRSRDVGGTGLGLAIVKHLARATGARVELRSLPGRGSTFILRLPR